MRKTAAQKARNAGLDSLSEMSKLSEVPERTLMDWTDTKPVTFDRLADGCAMQKKRQTSTEKDSKCIR